MNQEPRYTDEQRLLLFDPKHTDTLVEVVRSGARLIHPTGPRPENAHSPSKYWEGLRYTVKVVKTGEVLEDVEEKFLRPEGNQRR